MMMKGERLYRRVSDGVLRSLAAGDYAIGTRLPAERDLADTYAVSRATVREAMVALEMLGVVDMRKGSGIYIVGHPRGGEEAEDALDIGAFELMEARRLYETETAGVAAQRIDAATLDRLEALIAAMQADDGPAGELADRDFHLAIADATGNSAMAAVVADLWAMRERCSLARTILDRSRASGFEARIAEHRAILAALARRDAGAARDAMREHLDRVIEHLLAMTESEEIEAVRSRNADLRERLFSRA